MPGQAAASADKCQDEAGHAIPDAAPASTCETRERWVSVIGWQQGFVLVGVRTGTEGRPGQTNTHRAACELGKAARLGDYKHCACMSQK